MCHRYRLSVLLFVAVLSSAASVRAQLVWEPANRGTEGGYPRTFFETRAGTLLAASERAIYRFDATTASWTRSLTIREPWGSTVPTFGGDGTGAVIAASSTGVLRSTDDGATWTRIDSSANEIVADDRGMVVLLRHQELSRDLGETWEWRPRHSHVEALDGGLLIAAERTLLFVSDDTGRTWRERTVFGDEVRSLEVVDGSTIYSGTHAGLYRSTDAGARWQQLATFPVTEVAAVSGGRIAVASYVWNSATPNDAFYNSTDGGATWRRRLDGAPMSLAALESGELWAGYLPDLLRSTDDGATWIHAEAGMYERADSVFVDRDGVFYGVYEGYLLNVLWNRTGELFRSSDDGASWQSILDSVHSAFPLPGGAGLVANVLTAYYASGRMGFHIGAHVSTDRGATWRKVSDHAYEGKGEISNGLIVLPIRSNDSDEVREIYTSTDGGATWTGAPMPGRPWDVAVTPSGGIVASSVHGGEAPYQWALHRSGDTGRTWQSLLTGASGTDVFAFGEDRIVVIGRNDTTLQQFAWTSADAGASWTQQLLPLGYRGAFLDSGGTIVHFGQDGYNDVVATRSTDRGASWTSRSDTEIQSLWTAHQSHVGGLLAVSWYRIYQSTDGALSWRLLDDNPERRPWASLAMNERVMIGTAAIDGTFRTASVAGVEPPATSSGRTTLHVAPLPAVDRIVVDVPTGGALRITDARGVVVYHRDIEAAERVTIDLSGFATGLHILSLACDREVRIARLLIQR